MDKKHLDDMRIKLAELVGGENPAYFKNFSVEVLRATQPSLATATDGLLATILLQQYMTYDILKDIAEELKKANQPTVTEKKPVEKDKIVK